jgi:hypothetical protein
MQHSLEAMVDRCEKCRGGGEQRPVAARRKVIPGLRIDPTDKGPERLSCRILSE